MRSWSAPLSKPGHNGMRSREQRSEYAPLLARLETLPVIEQAKGILMAQSRSGEDQAFDLLRQAPQAALLLSARALHDGYLLPWKLLDDRPPGRGDGPRPIRQASAWPLVF